MQARSRRWRGTALGVGMLLSAWLAVPVAQADEAVAAPPVGVAQAPAANARGSPVAADGLTPSAVAGDGVEPGTPEAGDEDADRRAAAFMIGTVFALAFATAVGPRAFRHRGSAHATRARAGQDGPGSRFGHADLPPAAPPRRHRA